MASANTVHCESRVYYHICSTCNEFEWKQGIEPYYPVNDIKNQELFRQYQQLGNQEGNVVFGGRLGTYQYTDMQDTVINALELVSKEVLI